MIEMALYEMDELELDEKRVLIREDLNVPMEGGVITDDERIQRAIPTIKLALDSGAAVMVMSHLGRPQEGVFDAEFSLAPVAEALSKILKMQVPLIPNWLEGVAVKPGQLVLLENVRFNKGENANDEALSRKMARLCDVFVMDAFATAHRKQASTYGVIQYAPQVCAGPLLVEELEALTQAFRHPLRPLVAIIGGAKVSTKFKLLESLIDKVDQLIVGGGIANTFLKAQGYEIGKSLYEPDWVDNAKKVLAKAKAKNVQIILPTDVVVAKSVDEGANAQVKSLSDIAADECIFDVGPASQKSYAAILMAAKTVIWNGPVGLFEKEAFSHGTKALAEAVADSPAYTLAGGGDTIAALVKFGIRDKLSYISTGGGAFLEYLEGRELPALTILRERCES